LEAFLLTRYGTTPGRALCCIKILTETGGYLSFSDAFKRACFAKPHIGLISQKKLNKKRKTWIIIVCISCLLSSIFGKPITYYSLGLQKQISSDGWVQYYSLTRGFTVNFPNSPKEQSKQLEIAESGKVFNYEEVTSQQTKD